MCFVEDRPRAVLQGEKTPLASIVARLDALLFLRACGDGSVRVHARLQ